MWTVAAGSAVGEAGVLDVAGIAFQALPHACGHEIDIK
jgi:hypothetical protein